MPAPLQLHFRCDQDWNAMTPCAQGRFCGACQKPVHDLTQLDREGIRQFLRANPGACGQYTSEQLDPTLIPLDEVGAGMRRGFFAAIAALAIGGASAQQDVDPPRTEQGTSKHPVPSQAAPNELDHAIQLPDGSVVCPKPPAAQPPAPRAKSKIYIGGRFPFVHRRRHLRGRMMMGF